MACTLEQFIRWTIESGLLSVDEVKSFMLKIPQEKRPTKSEQLAKELVLANKLTKYQAAAIYQGKHKGLVFGQYAVLDQIGAGAMGQVYKAQHRRMKRVVALKVLPTTALRSKDSVERFHREVHAAGKLLHPNIVAAYDADESDGVPFLVLEYVDGVDLKTLYQSSTVSVSKAVDYLIQAARGLEFAHSQGVVHRDVKPANLLLDKSGVVKILDMGLARIHKEVSISEGLTRSGEIMGTVDYMSPEQAVNTHEADGRADQYSLGCTLYRLLTGEPVYAGDSMVAKVVAHRKLPIPSLREARPDVSPELEAVYKKMLAKDPDDRYATMTDVVAALEACQASAGKSSVRLNQESISADPDLKNFLSSLAAGEGGSSVSARPQLSGTATIHEEDPSLRINVDVHAPFLGQDSADEERPPAKAARPSLSRRQWLILGGAVAGAVLLFALAAVVGWLWFGRESKPKPPEKPPVAPVDPNNLLAQLDLNRDTVAGRLHVKLEGGSLVVTKQARIHFAREIPEEYDLALVIEKKVAAPGEAVVVGLPIAGTHRPVILSYFNNNKYDTGFTGKTVYDKPLFEEGKPTPIICRVRKDSVQIARGDEMLVDFQGDVATLPENEYWHVPVKDSFFLGFSAGEWQISKWELKPAP
jgi:serine/threonine protein kinase